MNPSNFGFFCLFFAFIRLGDVAECFESLEVDFPPEAEEVLTYFETYYIGGLRANETSTRVASKHPSRGCGYEFFLIVLMLSLLSPCLLLLLWFHALLRLSTEMYVWKYCLCR